MLKIKSIIMLDQLTSQEISKITDSSDFFSLSKLTEVKVSRSDECNCACIPFSSIAIGHELKFTEHNAYQTRVLWNTYPVRCCCMKLCETQLIAEEGYKFARTHTFALLTMVIALCTIKHL